MFQFSVYLIFATLFSGSLTLNPNRKLNIYQTNSIFNKPYFLVGDISIDPIVFEDVVNETIEAIRSNIPDPLVIDDLKLDFPEEGLLTYL